MKPCVCDSLSEVNTFKRPHEFWDLEKKIKASALLEVKVLVPLSQMGDPERWFRCPLCGKTWRLIPPDYPATGTWEPVPGL